MKNRSFLYLALVILISLLIVFLKNRKNKAIEPDYFSVADTSCVQSFKLYDQYDTLKFHKNGAWVINKNLKVKSSRIKDFLKVIKRIEIQSPIKGDAVKKYADSIKKYGTLVEIFCNDQLVRNYIFYENYQLNNINSFIFDLERNELFLVKIPGERGRLKSFFTTNYTDWNDRTLIHYKPGNIYRVVLEYTNNSKQSFIVEKDSNNTFNLYNLKEEKLYCSPESIERYFTYFRNVDFEKNGNIQETNLEKFAYMKIISQDGRFSELGFYRILQNNNGSDPKYDYNLAVVQKVSENQYYVIKYVQIDLLLKELQYFKY